MLLSETAQRCAQIRERKTALELPGFILPVGQEHFICCLSILFNSSVEGRTGWYHRGASDKAGC